MSLKVRCPKGCKLRVPNRRGGTVIRCPKCRAIIRVPAIDDMPEGGELITLRAELLSEAYDPHQQKESTQESLRDQWRGESDESFAVNSPVANLDAESGSSEFETPFRIDEAVLAEHHIDEGAVDHQFKTGNKPQTRGTEPSDQEVDRGGSSSSHEKEASVEEPSDSDSRPADLPILRRDDDGDESRLSVSTEQASDESCEQSALVDASSNHQAEDNLSAATEAKVSSAHTQSGDRERSSGTHEEPLHASIGPDETQSGSHELPKDFARDHADEPPSDELVIVEPPIEEVPIQAMPVEQFTESDSERPAGAPEAHTTADTKEELVRAEVRPVEEANQDENGSTSSLLSNARDSGESEESKETVGLVPDFAKQQASRAMAMVIVMAGIFTMGPSIFDLSIRWQQGPIMDLERWVLVLFFLGGVHFLYAAFVAQLPDWSSMWVVSILMLVLTCFDALCLGGLFIGSAEGPVATALQITAERRSQAMLWVLCMMSIHALLSYFCGREASRWKNTFDVYVSTLE